VTTISNVAERILDENGYDLTDFPHLTLTIVEYKINDAIDYVNLQAGLSISHLSGTAESKSITATDGQILAVKWLTNLMLRAYKDKGSQISVANVNISLLLNDPDYKTTMMMIEKTLERLKELPIVIANDPLPNE